MDAILLDIVRGEIAYSFHSVSSTSNLNLVAFHRFLNGCADITNADVNSGGLHEGQLSIESLVSSAKLDTLMPMLVASLTAAKRLS